MKHLSRRHALVGAAATVVPLPSIASAPDPLVGLVENWRTVIKTFDDDMASLSRSGIAVPDQYIDDWCDIINTADYAIWETPARSIQGVLAKLAHLSADVHRAALTHDGEFIPERFAGLPIEHQRIVELHEEAKRLGGAS